MLVLIPAYGRDYKSISAASNDWHDNKDFRIIDGAYTGSYINKADAKKYGVDVVTILINNRDTAFVQQV